MDYEDIFEESELKDVSREFKGRRSEAYSVEFEPGMGRDYEADYRVNGILIYDRED